MMRPRARPRAVDDRWDRCWDCPENHSWWPDEQVVRFLARHVARRMGTGRGQVRWALRRRPVALDLGCGKGRHVVLLAELGARAHGLDVSRIAVSFARRWLRARRLDADLRLGSMERLPYPAASFDAVICHGVLDHVLAAVRRSAVKEVERVLRPGGLFFFSVIAADDSARGRGRRVERETWILDEGFERGLPQAFFTPRRIRAEFSRFRIEGIVHASCEAVHGRSLIGTDKHYQRDARYYVTAVKGSARTRGARGGPS